MWLLFTPNMLLFLGPSLPSVDSLLAALVREGMQLILPEKSDPDVTGGSFPMGHITLVVWCDIPMMK